MSTTILKSSDTLGNIVPMSTSVTIPVTGINLVVIPTSFGVSCGVKISDEVVY